MVRGSDAVRSLRAGPPRRPTSSTDYAAALVAAGLPDHYAHALADSDRGIAAGDLHDDTHTLSTLIRRPTTTLADAVKAALV